VENVRKSEETRNWMMGEVERKGLVRSADSWMRSVGDPVTDTPEEQSRDLTRMKKKTFGQETYYSRNFEASS
jgi:hypothetical protein